MPAHPSAAGAERVEARRSVPRSVTRAVMNCNPRSQKQHIAHRGGDSAFTKCSHQAPISHKGDPANAPVGVHKNETPANRLGESLRRGVTPIAATAHRRASIAVSPERALRLGQPVPTKRSEPVRALRTLVLTAVTALALAGPGVRARPPAHHRRLDLGTSPRAETRRRCTTRKSTSRTPKVTGGQSDIGISGVNEGRFDIGDSSRDPIVGTDPKGLVFTKIARDGVCIITNKSNPITTLSQSTVENIFTGQIRDWSQVPGAKISRPDRPVRPRRRLRYAGRLPAHLPGRKREDLPKRHGRRRPTASRKTRSPPTSRRSGSCPSPTRKA